MHKHNESHCIALHQGVHSKFIEGYLTKDLIYFRKTNSSCMEFIQINHSMLQKLIFRIQCLAIEVKAPFDPIGHF